MKPFVFSVALIVSLLSAQPLLTRVLTQLLSESTFDEGGTDPRCPPFLLEVHTWGPAAKFGALPTNRRCLHAIATFPEAAQYYRKALSLNPQLLPARKNLGVVLWFAGHQKETALYQLEGLPEKGQAVLARDFMTQFEGSSRVRSRKTTERRRS